MLSVVKPNVQPQLNIMGLLKLVIFVDQPVYYSGQNISGRLVVEVSKPMLMRAIYLKYSGKGNVLWTESESSGDESRSDTYSNHEQYLGLQQLVFGNDKEDSELAEGEHVFVFGCQLPMNLPASFEAAYGNVRYTVTATVHRSWKSNYVAIQPITVMSISDLNLNPSAAIPVAERASKTFWGHSKPLHMSVDLPVRGFVPGQSIPIKVFLNNPSGVQITSLYVALEQNVTFRATSKSRSVTKVVLRKAFPLPKGLECMEVPVSLQLPAVPSSYLEFCKIIELKYQLHITATSSGWYHRNLTIRTELVVGNIPLLDYQRPTPANQILRGSVDRENPTCSQTPEDAPPPYGYGVPPGMIYEDLPPPTYERAVGLGDSDKGKPETDRGSGGGGEVKQFAPLYPVYAFADTKDHA